jgi:diguanylate cyclase (GGDEF)-like protein
MLERRAKQRGRTLFGGKIVFNGGRSAIDCVVRNLSADGACVQVESPVGIPDHVVLTVIGESEPRSCIVAWQSANRVGLTFHGADAADVPQSADPESVPDFMRGEMPALRAALDEVKFGVVLLDGELRAQFINRAFRKMWRLPDSKADAKPPFVALMYHGRDMRAYKIPIEELDDYVAERVALVRAGDPTPRDVRLSNGEVIRLQCAALSNGGRLLSYTYVTDIVRHSDELNVLRAALNEAREGIIVLDAELNVQFMNRTARQLTRISDKQAESHPAFSQLIGDSRSTGIFGAVGGELDMLISQRIASIREGTATPQDLRMSDGRYIRSRCAALPNGGRILTYWDVTDLVRSADELEKLATFDAMTGLYNRRHFLTLADAEWDRFQRYQRPLSMLMLDIDHFKLVDDRYGHAAGDAVISSVANACQESKRSSDIVGRIGSEEYALLLPETDLTQAIIVAERIRSRIAAHAITGPDGDFTITVSVGVAPGTLSMSGINALMHAAGQALYRARAEGGNRVTPFDPAERAEPRLAAQ